MLGSVYVTEDRATELNPSKRENRIVRKIPSGRSREERESQDPLSPLRSPLRPEDSSNRRDSCERRYNRRHHPHNSRPGSRSLVKSNKELGLTGGNNSSGGEDLIPVFTPESKAMKETGSRPCAGASVRDADPRRQLKRESIGARGARGHKVPGSEELGTECDKEVLARREKQISYGKNTNGYENYISAVPKKLRTVDHPRTPDKLVKFSRRSWDTQVKIWRRTLHLWDNTQLMAVSETTSNVPGHEDLVKVNTAPPSSSLQPSETRHEDLIHIDPLSPEVHTGLKENEGLSVPQVDEALKDFMDLAAAPQSEEASKLLANSDSDIDIYADDMEF